MLNLIPILALGFHIQYPYKVYEKDKISPAEFAARRAVTMASIPSDAIGFISTNAEMQRSNDTDFRFRPNSDFWYLTGCEEPDSALLLAPGGISVDGTIYKEILFVNDKIPSSETWTGVRMGPTNAQQILGVAAVMSNSKLAQVLEKATQSKFMAGPTITGARGTLKRMIDSFTSWSAGKQSTGRLAGIVAKQRIIKSPAEILLIKKAMKGTIAGHMEALKSCEPKMHEFEIQALVEYMFKRNGCEDVAYGCIVGSGESSVILHYMSNRKQIANGDFICMDVGGEYHGYATDVTRSYPANGKFSKEQAELYELVRAAQQAGVEACKPGNNFGAPDGAARKIITEGLIKLGLAKTAAEANRYFMHGTSHHVGLDVHDPQPDMTLRPGMVITVEPGIYIAEGSPVDKKYWNIGIRIEDTVLMTETGCENLSAAVPRDIAGIERLMGQKGLGNTAYASLMDALTSLSL